MPRRPSSISDKLPLPETFLPARGAIPGAQLGVLFDIDDTLLNLVDAQRATFTELIADQLGEDILGHEEFETAMNTFAADLNRHYGRYIAGELTFVGQRMARVTDAMAVLGYGHITPSEAVWAGRYEELVRTHWKLFDDVLPLLERLDRAGIAYGAVSNNVEAFQRAKLIHTGLNLQVVIGTDTTGKPKPAPEPFLQGLKDLGVSRGVMVGDNPTIDGEGARDAGLISIVLDRAQKLDPIEDVINVATLTEVGPIVEGL